MSTSPSAVPSASSPRPPAPPAPLPPAAHRPAPAIPFGQLLGSRPPARLAPPAHAARTNGAPPEAHAAHEPPRVGARRDPREGAEDEPAEHPPDPLDPATRQAAQLAPLGSTPAPTASPLRPVDEVTPSARVSIEELLPQLVRRIAWAGDRRRGSVQLELGAGRHAGTTVTVHAEDGRVRVELQGHDVEELRARIATRLERRGIHVDSVA